VLTLPEIINLFYGSPQAQKPYNPSYPNATIDGYADSLKLSWLGGINTTKYRVYIGTDSSHLLRVADSVAVATAAYTLGGAAPQSTYYWRVDAIGALGTTTGDLWSFKTGNPKGLVAHYALDATAGTQAFDSTAYVNHGAFRDMPNAVWMKGKFNNALGFGKPPATGAIVIPDAQQIRFDNNSFTISMWLKLPAYNYVNLSAGVDWDNGLGAMLYVTNLFDENALLSFDRERVDQDVDLELAEQQVLLDVAEGSDGLVLDLALDARFLEGFLSGGVGERLAGHRPAFRDHPPPGPARGHKKDFRLLPALDPPGQGARLQAHRDFASTTHAEVIDPTGDFGEDIDRLIHR